MSGSKTNVDSDDVLRGAALTLFVEGNNGNAFDPTVIKEIFKETIRVKTLGAASSVKAAAEAFSQSHPKYYFLIDRDFHHNDDFVNERWKLFPSGKENNLLIWRRKEIENYFLDPEYLKSSKFYRPSVSTSDLEDKILQLANERLYLDAANYVLIDIREDVKGSGIEKIDDKDIISNDRVALEKLLEKLNPAIQRYKEKFNDELSYDKIKNKFYEELKKMTGDKNQLKFGSGKWNSMIEGKKILNDILSPPAFFKVEGNNNQVLQGRNKTNEIIKELLKNSSILQPKDFNELKTLIDNKIIAARTQQNKGL